MSDIPLSLLFAALFFLVIFSAFFSSSETGMMSLNRYRMRHLAKQGHGGAKRATKLLNRTDRLIGVILIGNNFVNIAAASIATIIAQRIWVDNPELGVSIATVLLTLVILIFSEVTPKTIAANHPEKIAFPASYLLQPLLILLMPFVYVVNGIANILIRITGLKLDQDSKDLLSTEEFRTLVHEAGALIPRRRQQMLLSILDLETVRVNDIMVPRNEIIGIDLDEDIRDIETIMRTSQHTRLPVWKGNINNIIGILHMRNAAKILAQTEFNKAELLQVTREPYFIPETAQLHNQLFNFQTEQRRIAIVVDEYGNVQGIATLEDILEEIVGDFTSDASNTSKDITPQDDDSFIIDGTITIRELNKALDFDLPTSGPKTFSGLIIESLESIPENNVCLKIDNYRIEILKVRANTIKSAKICKV
ncbi:HlyC/CorC family transporter [Bermanella sp. WJH001]|uniref:HlyC/CorC family transporter n=1 Tax=Bermanella sp. WJH001 TaxID=3048005 RepID=UPI0024BDE89D|nr:HlyC/CorC family transporter [Bermanella sp. WJH001]MDJ1538056.1 HlyC/CorC family transporter [Bermanella sp. WJH001]